MNPSWGFIVAGHDRLQSGRSESEPLLLWEPTHCTYVLMRMCWCGPLFQLRPSVSTQEAVCTYVSTPRAGSRLASRTIWTNNCSFWCRSFQSQRLLTSVSSCFVLTGPTQASISQGNVQAFREVAKWVIAHKPTQGAEGARIVVDEDIAGNLIVVV